MGGVGFILCPENGLKGRFRRHRMTAEGLAFILCPGGEWIGGAGGSDKGDRKKAGAIASAYLWSQQGMILRLPDYESGALTN